MMEVGWRDIELKVAMILSSAREMRRARLLLLWWHIVAGLVEGVLIARWMQLPLKVDVFVVAFFRRELVICKMTSNDTVLQLG